MEVTPQKHWDIIDRPSGQGLKLYQADLHQSRACNNSMRLDHQSRIVALSLAQISFKISSSMLEGHHQSKDHSFRTVLTTKALVKAKIRTLFQIGWNSSNSCLTQRQYYPMRSSSIVNSRGIFRDNRVPERNNLIS